MNDRPRVGLIVNPIAGMGGRVGLKGTDSPDAVTRALELGAEPVSGTRAQVALSILRDRMPNGVEVVTVPGECGESVARGAGFEPHVIDIATTRTYTQVDTIRAAQSIVAAGVDLLLFAGGDGTARNIYEAVGTTVPVIGIPTGVKMHSSVFATNPRNAGELAAHFLTNPRATCRDSEVMDIDEIAFQDGRVSAQLFGYLKVPYQRSLVQGLKAGSSGTDRRGLEGIAMAISQRMQNGALWILGPGSTTHFIATSMGLDKTLLGVDLYQDGKAIAHDASERDILGALGDAPARIVVTPIGGQGYLFGRGNQQLSPEVIRRVGTANIIVVATRSKLAGLGGAHLLVDTGDVELDRELSGYIRVLVDLRQESMQRVA